MQWKLAVNQAARLVELSLPLAESSPAGTKCMYALCMFDGCCSTEAPWASLSPAGLFHLSGGCSAADAKSPAGMGRYQLLHCNDSQCEAGA